MKQAQHTRREGPGSGAHRLSQPFDFALAGVALVLLGIGLVMIASASISTADRQFGAPLYYFWRQMGFVIFGVLLAWGGVRIDTRVWQQYNPPAYT